jgi:hypothetical protein
MRGEGKISDAISRLFYVARQKYMGDPDDFEFDCTLFDHKAGDSQLSLF